MVHVGLDLSRRRIDVCVIDDDGSVVEEFAAFPDADGLRLLASRLSGTQVRAVIESMTGARFVHDFLEEAGWTVEIADAARVKALGPVAAKTDRIDARLLATLSHRDLVPSIWLPSPGTRGDRELARFRLFLVKRRTSVKNRIHSSLITWGITIPVSDLFGAAGREFLTGLDLPQRWQETIAQSLEVIDYLDDQIEVCAKRLRQAGADDPQVQLLKTAPGIADILAFTIASEIGDINRFPAPNKLVSYSGLAPRVIQSGESDRRGPLTKAGPAGCDGHSSKPPSTPPGTPHTPSPIKRSDVASAPSEDPTSLGSTPPDGSPPRSGGCSPEANPSLREAPSPLWPHRRPKRK